ncbi:hypothetical protein NQ314_017146 [Rhamnusium bicolor]|uniref:Uncharacterized protein n=1 Tax=Rhamnusium bicolor TaxID=1586634 RepID=A0AAV8WWS3_9CUCU|nr:hypothetical protein NQ314_017146 [Rhamnusium bicolor]
MDRNRQLLNIDTVAAPKVPDISLDISPSDYEEEVQNEIDTDFRTEVDTQDDGQFDDGNNKENESVIDERASDEENATEGEANSYGKTIKKREQKGNFQTKKA